MAGLAGVRQKMVQASVAGRYDLYLGVGGGLALLGAALFAMQLGGGEEQAARAWHLFHVCWIYFTGLAGGSVAIAAIHKVVNAKWSGVLIRFAQASVSFLPISYVMMLVIFTVGYPHIYGHMTSVMHTLPASKQWWLSHPVMFTRLAVGLAVLYYLGWQLVHGDMVPDMFEARNVATGARKARFEAASANFDGSEGAHERQDSRLKMFGCLYIVTYAIMFTLVAFDGMMALQPHWFSNLFGGWYFMGSILGGHMLLQLQHSFGGKHLGIEEYITRKQRHDLGKLCFGFTIFWTYLMWAQFQVIWYANLPEETGFVFSRLYGDWLPLGLAVGVGMFIIPFFGLLGVEPKKTRLWAIIIACESLTALFLERYLMVIPSVSEGASPTFGLPEVGALALVAGLYMLMYALFARTFPMVSPRLAMITLEKEMHHHGLPAGHVAAH